MKTVIYLFIFMHSLIGLSAYQINDCHMHFVDFLQETDGIEKALEAMDKANVNHVIIFGMELIKKWEDIEPDRPKYYLSDDARCYWYSMTDVIVADSLLKLDKNKRQRFHPFICGIDPTDRNSIEHIKRMVRLYPNLFEGIGEIFLRHDDLTALTYGQTATPENIALDPICEFAKEHDMPVFIHCDISSVWRRTPSYLPEMEKLLNKHPNTKIVWCHCGISRRIIVDNLVDIIRSLLKKHKNLFFDISWVFYDMYLVKKDKILPDWLPLFEEFPEKFLIGSDVVGHFKNYKKIIEKYDLILNSLSPIARKKIAEENFFHILPSKKVVLE